MTNKVNRIERLTSAMAGKTKKAAVRDAVSSSPGSAKTAKRGGKAAGKNIAQLLEEQQALKQLSADIKGLKSSSARLAASSRWLYTVSK
jgi:hypothetical protein